jgi:hypothetical protein
MAEIEYYDLVADIGGEEQGDMSPWILSRASNTEFKMISSFHS